MARWERWEGSEWERWENGETERWEVPCFIQGWGTQDESKISSFVSDVNQGNEGLGWVQDFLVWLQGWKDSP